MNERRDIQVVSRVQDVDDESASTLDRLEDKIDWLIETNTSTRRELGRVRHYLLALALVSIFLGVWIAILNSRQQADIQSSIERTGQETADTVLRNLPLPDAQPASTPLSPHPAAAELPPAVQPAEEVPLPAPRAPGFRPLDLRAPPELR